MYWLRTLTVSAGLIAVTFASAGDRPGRPALGPWACPATHPIKGYLSAESGRVYFVPTHLFYDEASPERCYATEEEARGDGSRPAGAAAPLPAAVELTPSLRRSA